MKSYRALGILFFYAPLVCEALMARKAQCQRDAGRALSTPSVGGLTRAYSSFLARLRREPSLGIGHRGCGSELFNVGVWRED